MHGDDALSPLLVVNRPASRSRRQDVTGSLEAVTPRERLVLRRDQGQGLDGGFSARYCELDGFRLNTPI
jgi:hypothetical protein